jgi:YHS domain-containing protein
MAKDPVCGMEIDEPTAAGRSEYNGKIYYFCAPGCMQAFDDEPEKFVGQEMKHATEEPRRHDALR